MSVEIHKEGGKPVSVTIPYSLYEEFLDFREEKDILPKLLKISEDISSGRAESFPLEVTERIIAGESPIKVYREYRGLTQVVLAQKAGISRPYLTEIETGKKEGSITSLKSIAKSLNVDLEDIV